MLWTTLWVVFCFLALVGIVVYFVRMVPGPWVGRDRKGNYPYVIGDGPDDESGDADDIEGTGV